MVLTKDPEALAVAILHILRGAADPVFPQSTRAHPSWVVQVTPHPGKIVAGCTPYFPMWVNGYLWNDAVVPVIEDPSFDASSPVSQSLPPGTLIQDIETRLVAKMIETGYLPESTV